MHPAQPRVSHHSGCSGIMVGVGVEVGDAGKGSLSLSSGDKGQLVPRKLHEINS